MVLYLGAFAVIRMRLQALTHIRLTAAEEVNVRYIVRAPLSPSFKGLDVRWKRNRGIKEDS